MKLKLLFIFMLFTVSSYAQNFNNYVTQLKVLLAATADDVKGAFVESRAEDIEDHEVHKTSFKLDPFPIENANYIYRDQIGWFSPVKYYFSSMKVNSKAELKQVYEKLVSLTKTADTFKTEQENAGVDNNGEFEEIGFAKFYKNNELKITIDAYEDIELKQQYIHITVYKKNSYSKVIR